MDYLQNNKDINNYFSLFLLFLKNIKLLCGSQHLFTYKKTAYSKSLLKPNLIKNEKFTK